MKDLHKEFISLRSHLEEVEPHVVKFKSKRTKIAAQRARVILGKVAKQIKNLRASIQDEVRANNAKS